jgi:hypothetical protein
VFCTKKNLATLRAGAAELHLCHFFISKKTGRFSPKRDQPVSRRVLHCDSHNQGDRIGQIFAGGPTLDTFLKITEVVQMDFDYFFPVKNLCTYVWILPKMVVAIFWSIFFTNSSGHTGEFKAAVVVDHARGSMLYETLLL